MKHLYTIFTFWMIVVVATVERTEAKPVRFGNVVMNDTVVLPEAGDSLRLDIDMETKADTAETVPAGVDTVYIKKPYHQRYQGDKVVYMENNPEYSLQRRYLKRGKPFRHNYFYDHVFVGGSIGWAQVAPRGGMETTGGTPLSIFVGNDFNRLHAARLTFTYNMFSLRNYRRDIRQLGFDVDYMFNLSAYFNGYDPDRIFSVAGTIGIGGMRSHFMGERCMVYKGQAGLQMVLHVGHNARIFAEPFFAITTDQIDHSGSANPANHDILYGVKAGMSFRLGTDKEANDGTNYNGNIFFDLSQGAAVYHSGTLSLMETMGTNYTISAGKWFDPAVALRLSFSATDYLWEGASVAPTEALAGYDRYYRAALITGRVEALVNPINFSRKARKKQRAFDLNVAIGGEVGRMKKNVAGGKGNLDCHYIGLTAALQGLYHVTPATSFFVEPRVLVANYAIPYRNVPREERYTDYLGMLNAGVRFTRPAQAGSAKRRNDGFDPHLFASVYTSGLKRVTHVKTVAGKGLNYAAGLGIGYHFAPCTGARLGIDYMSYFHNRQRPYTVELQGAFLPYKAMWKNRTGLLNISAEYMLNLANLYQGYDSGRKLDVYLTAGPVYSICLDEQAGLYEKELQVGVRPTPTDGDMSGDGSWGFTGGVVADYKLTAHWSLQAEPKIQYFFKKDFFPQSARGINGLFVRFNIGATYYF